MWSCLTLSEPPSPVRIAPDFDITTLAIATLWPARSRNEGWLPARVTTDNGDNWPSAPQITPSPLFSGADPPRFRLPGIASAPSDLLNFSTPRTSTVGPL